MTLYIGLMSGTSMDGIDAALVDLPANKLIHGLTKKYSEETKKRIEQFLVCKDLSLASICQLNTLIGREFAGAVNDLLQEANISPAQIDAIGSHGQTVCHDTSCTIPYTLQLGCAHTISSLTGITVVADFRNRDLVNGGQGAPFAPLYHQELFKDVEPNLAIVNIGGISNVTFISKQNPTIGWDIGPGNCLMDLWIFLNQGKAYDADGAWARKGVVLAPLLEHLLADPFFKLSPPKSIGKEYFSFDWLNTYLKQDYQAKDIQATLLALTAHSIADTISSKNDKIAQLYLCGGGAHNILLHDTLKELLPNIKVSSIAEAGVSPDFLEAMMFAWMASLTLNGKPVDLSTITGAKNIEILGAIYPIIKSY